MQPSLFDFSFFPVLTTERLVLRAFVPEDASDLYAFRSDVFAQKFNDPPMTDLPEAYQLIKWMNDGFAAHEMIQWAVVLRETNRVIGLFGFNSWDRGHNRAAIGYNLDREYWGQGLSKEALAAMLRFGFENMWLNRIESETVADNTESVRLLERSGFHLDGVRREFTLEEDGTYHGGAIYSILRREYFKS
jgi:ribosomal-protein-alanine N-acetyltransferase